MTAVEVLLNGTTGGVQSTGAIFPADAKSTGTTGWSAAAVLSPERITADDTLYAYLMVSTFDTGDKSAILHAYSFDVSAVPFDATIVGCIVKIAAWSPVGAASIGFCNILDDAVSILKLGNEQAATPVSLPSSIGVITFGSENSTWGVTLTKDLFTGYFGVGFGFIADADDTDLYVDYVTMELFYIEQNFQDAYEVLMDEGQTSYHMGIGEYV